MFFILLIIHFTKNLPVDKINWEYFFYLAYSTAKNATQESAKATVKLDEEELPLDGSLTFTSSNDDVATVSSDGTITAKEVGVATISVTDKYNHVASEDIEVILEDEII